MRKRNLIISIGLILVIATSSVVWLWLNEASINYGFNVDYKYEKQGDQWFTVDVNSNNHMNDTFININCANAGYLDGTFSLIIKLTNAMFSTKTQQPYEQIDSNTVKVTYILHQNERKSPNIYFTIEENVISFVISLSIEHGQTLMRSHRNGIETLTFIWDSSQNAYLAPVPAH